MRLPSIGMKFKGLADVAHNYHAVLNENRRLYNEVQDLKGSIFILFSLLHELSQFRCGISQETFECIVGYGHSFQDKARS